MFMFSYAGRSMDNVNQYRGLSTDIVNSGGKILTNDETINRKLKNGDEVYCFDNGDTYIYDEENGTLIIQ